MNIIATKVINEDVSEEELSTTGSLTRKANMESPDDASSPEHPLQADTDDTGTDLFNVRDVEGSREPEPVVAGWGISTVQPSKKKNKKRHPSANLWE